MDVNGVRDAASVLGLKSYVGPLADMTDQKRVAKAFDHGRLEPAVGELKTKLKQGCFEGSHAELAVALRERIMKFVRIRKDRDRKRQAKATVKQVSWQVY